MVKALTTDEFISNATKKHSSRFDYSKLIYTTSKNKIEVVCGLHGSFWTKPHDHLKNLSGGCLKCASKHSIDRQSSTTEEFIAKAKSIHGDRFVYDLVEYKNSRTHVEIICKKHGNFKTSPHNHFKPSGCCRLCGFQSIADTKTYTQLDFLNASKKVHGDLYDYSKAVYLKSYKDVVIICPIHGEFNISPNEHQQGQGCKKCGYLRTSIKNAEVSTGWGLSRWSESIANSPTFDSFKLYFLKLSDDKESFYKVGRTYRKLGERTYKLPYTCETIQLLEHTDPKIIFDLEAHLKRTFKSYKYTPLKKFNGMGECFKFDDSTIESVIRQMTLTSIPCIIPTSTK